VEVADVSLTLTKPLLADVPHNVPQLWLSKHHHKDAIPRKSFRFKLLKDHNTLIFNKLQLPHHK
jgi:hypothetical protein